MFAYNPTVNDMSGQIMGAGQLQAAATNAESMVGLGENIGEALKSVGGSFGESIKEAREGESAYTALQSIGKMYPAIGKITGALDQLDPRTRHMAARQVLGNFGALSQFAIAGMNNETRQQAPYVAADIKNRQNIAGGNVPHGGGGGMAPVEPPLPVKEEDLPAVVGAASAAPRASIPGGQASIDAINRDRQRRGLEPIK